LELPYYAAPELKPCRARFFGKKGVTRNNAKARPRIHGIAGTGSHMPLLANSKGARGGRPTNARRQAVLMKYMRHGVAHKIFPRQE
jgi:hypothetical protein